MRKVNSIVKLVMMAVISVILTARTRKFENISSYSYRDENTNTIKVEDGNEEVKKGTLQFFAFARGGKKKILDYRTAEKEIVYKGTKNSFEHLIELGKPVKRFMITLTTKWKMPKRRLVYTFNRLRGKPKFRNFLKHREGAALLNLSGWKKERNARTTREETPILFERFLFGRKIVEARGTNVENINRNRPPIQFLKKLEEIAQMRILNGIERRREIINKIRIELEAFQITKWLRNKRILIGKYEEFFEIGHLIINKNLFASSSNRSTRPTARLKGNISFIDDKKYRDAPTSRGDPNKKIISFSSMNLIGLAKTRGP